MTGMKDVPFAIEIAFCLCTAYRMAKLKSRIDINQNQTSSALDMSVDYYFERLGEVANEIPHAHKMMSVFPF